MNAPDYYANSQISTFIERIKFDHNKTNIGGEILLSGTNFNCYETEKSECLSSQNYRTSKVCIFLYFIVNF